MYNSAPLSKFHHYVDKQTYIYKCCIMQINKQLCSYYVTSKYLHAHLSQLKTANPVTTGILCDEYYVFKYDRR